MGNLHHQGYGSSSLWGLYNTYTNYNLNDGADDCIFYSKVIISKFHFHHFSITFPLAFQQSNAQSEQITSLRELNPSCQGPSNKHYSLAFEVLRKKGVVMGKLGVPALTCHTLWSDIHCASVICALSLDTGYCYIDICVLTWVRVWQRKKKT